MKTKPIYVEIPIHVPIQQVWDASQNPEMHAQWDLRFSTISYLPKKEEEPQLFTYTRNVGPFLTVEGWGKSSGSVQLANGSRSSSLHFGTDQKISPIREGRGFWKYEPIENGTKFLTQYDYTSSFGKAGNLFDLFFRPIIGYATALSFDVLKRWLEKGETPASQYFRYFSMQLLILFFSFIWIYQGLVPKLIAMHPQEKSMVAGGLSITDEQALKVVFAIGAAEIVFGFIWLFYRNKRHLLLLQIIVFPLLTFAALIASPETAIHPFNPVTFNLSLILITAIGLLVSRDIPTAASCKRKK
ncbi:MULTISPECIES: DoxX-like family protein [unclassified Sporosarcina]|uniref:DoxX-like family protein n=1 Tax=unclassified Sporosarcina TaxID=2647733 RepID=UPI00203DB5B3|nr:MULTISPECIES: DoxX-like family protein [unclassified Sporosarcina]GKV64722.1 membrane protein [Sporosarcina sp. NCCP-2331]GLB54832.1 membrane protein [Sporosarcina sp. NCCP-2378]